MTVKNNYLSKLVECFENSQTDYLGCNVRLFMSKKSLAAKYNCLYDFNIENDINNNHYSPTCSLTVRKDVFKTIGIFDDRLESGGDWEFGQRVYKYGMNQYFAKNIIMLHPSRYSYSSIINKSTRIARGIAQLAFYYPKDCQLLFDGYFKIRSFLPFNPINILKNAKNNNINLNLIEGIILSIYHVPIRIISFISLLKEKRKLLAAIK